MDFTVIFVSQFPNHWRNNSLTDILKPGCTNSHCIFCIWLFGYHYSGDVGLLFGLALLALTALMPDTRIRHFCNRQCFLKLSLTNRKGLAHNAASHGLLTTR